MEYILSITFICETGDKTTLTIEGVKPNLPRETISTLMDTIITNNVFNTKSGALTTKASASMIEKTTTSYTFTE